MQYCSGIKSVINRVIDDFIRKIDIKKSGSGVDNKDNILSDFPQQSVVPLGYQSPSRKNKNVRNINIWSGSANLKSDEDIVSTNSIQPLFEVRFRGHLPEKQIESEIPKVEEPLSAVEWRLEKTTSEDLLKKEGNTRDLEEQIISHSSGSLGEGSGRLTRVTESLKSELSTEASGVPPQVKHRGLISSSISIFKTLTISSPLLSRSIKAISAIMDHEDLISELPQIEKLSNQERLRLAHKRRMLQLKKFQQYDKEITSRKHKIAVNESRKSGGKGLSNGKASGKPGGKRIRFRNSIMLLEAAGRNDVDEVRKLLSSGVSPDVCNEDGLTALHQCCIDDNEEMMKVLLDYGANVNSEDSERWTPLHAAATCGHLHLVKYLITKGANLLAVNAEGNMPYDICDEEATLDYIESEMAKRGVTQELIEETRALPETQMLQDVQNILVKGGDLESRDVDAATPLHIAAANGYYRVVELLLDNHVATDVQDKDNWQPIHAAACWGHLDVLELLVQNGADLNARTRNNETPYAICEDPEIKERIIQLRSEQETKQQEAARQKRLRRTQSSNSRTQSIRRTSQRDKGLTSKRDTANEAQMLMTREDSLKDTSPSPTTDMNNVVVPINNHNQTETSSEEDPEDVRNLPPAAFGRDSIPHIKVASNEMERLQSIASKGGSNNSDTIVNNNLKSNNIKNNNINSNINNQSKQFTNPVSIPVTDTNANLPKPEINPPIDNKVQIGPSGISLSGSRDSLVGVGNSTIDIHVSVTINTNSPSSTLTNGGTTPYITSGITPGSTLLSPPGTLADLKKHRSLIRTTSNPSNGTSNNVTASCKDLVSYPSLRYPTGFPMESNPSVAYENACCNWDMNYSQSEFDSSAFAYSGSMVANSHPVSYDSISMLSSYPYGSGVMHKTNQLNNQVYINNLTGVMNDLPHKYDPPPSPTVSLRRFAGSPTEIVGDYGDGGKKCCTIV